MSGRCIQRGRTVRDCELQRLLIGAPGVVQSTLRDANVGESDSATEDVGDGAGTLQAQHALAVGFGAPIPGRHWPRMQVRGSRAERLVLPTWGSVAQPLPGLWAPP